MQAWLRLVPLGLLAAGCGRYYDPHHVHTGRGRGEFVSLIGGRTVVDFPPPEPEPVYISNVDFVRGAAPAPLPPRSLRDDPEPESAPPPFDPQAARAALNAVDVSSCRAAGAPRGLGHARVTMNPDGRVSKVVIDEPANLAPSAVDCVGNRLAEASVPPFRGSLVTMGTAYAVP